MQSDTDTESLRPKRRLRNYLLDARFQLRYVGLLAGTAFVLISLLGSVVATTSSIAIREARASTELAQLAAEQAARAVAETEASARVLRLHQLSLSDPGGPVARSIEAELARVDLSARSELARVRGFRERAFEQQRRVEALRPRLLTWIVASGLALVLALALLGIVITHRVVGPAWRMRRLLAKVGAGRLRVDERLRRGDELGALYDAFVAMVGALRGARQEELMELDRAIGATEPTSAALPRLRALSAKIRASLSDVPPG
jgi:HAMP domain-containing protein